MTDPDTGTTWAQAAAAYLKASTGLQTLTSQLGDWVTGTTTGGPGSDGRYPFIRPDGTTILVPSPAEIIQNTDSVFTYPDETDPLAGSGNPNAVPPIVHDDAPAIQAMFERQKVAPYPRPALRPNKRYRCGSTIYVDPSRASLEGNHATIGWDYKDFVNPAALPNLITSDPGFDTGAGWIKSSGDTHTDGVDLIYNGAVRATQPNPDKHFYFERGQQLQVAAGQSFTVKITLLSLVKNSVSDGNTFHDILFTLRNPSGQLGGGNVGSTSYTIRDDQSDYVPGKTWTWTVSSSVDNPYMRIQSDASFEIDLILAQVVPNNNCIIVRVPPAADGGTLRGHNQREFANFALTGRSGQGSYVDAVLFDTPVYKTPSNTDLGQHSRCNWRNFQIADDVGRGLVLANRTYLNLFYGFRMVCSVACVDTLGGDDTGENITFFGGGLGGGICVRNLAKMALRFVDTSMDFSTQWLVGDSMILENCWLETNQQTGSDTFKGSMKAGSNVMVTTDGGPVVLGSGSTISGAGLPAGTTLVSNTKQTINKVDTWTMILSNNNTNTADTVNATYSYYHQTQIRPLIDCTSGKITIRNTLIQVDGDTNSRLESPFRVAAKGWLSIEANPAYNLDGRAGCLCVGAGRFDFRQIGTGTTRNVETINKRDDEHNVLGDTGHFESSTVDVPAFVVAQGGQRRIDRNTVMYDSRSTFVGAFTRGSEVMLGLTTNPTNAYLGRELISSAVPAGTTIVGVQTAPGITFTGTMTVGSNRITGVTPQPTSGNAYRRFVTGPGIPAGARVLAYDGTSLTLDKECNASGSQTIAVPNAIEMSSRATADIAAGNVTYRIADTSSALIRTTSAFTPYDGTRCLELFKDLPDTEQFMAYLAIPCEGGRGGYGSELRWAVPPFNSGRTSADIYFQPYFRRIIDADGPNPRLTGQSLQLTDYPKTGIPPATGTDGWQDRDPFSGQTGLWRSMSISLNSPGLGFHSGIVPEWATHLVWQINLVGLPRGGSLLIDAVIGNNQ